MDKVNTKSNQPMFQTTTLWDFSCYDNGLLHIIFNLIMRYTKKQEVVIEIGNDSKDIEDICEITERLCLNVDINDTENPEKVAPDDNSVDMIFVNLPKTIGKISQEDSQYYQELEKIVEKCQKALKPGKTIGLLVSDNCKKKKFTPVGFNAYGILAKYFETVDIVCVRLKNQYTEEWHEKSKKYNFFLPDFRYLFIMKKM